MCGGYGIRYFVRIRIARSYSSISKEFDFSVQRVEKEPAVNNELKMEVGIEDCLHIEFEYDQSKYHLKVWSLCIWRSELKFECKWI